MLRKITSILAAGILVATVATAQADGHVKRMDWTGGYAGLHAGGAFGDFDRGQMSENGVVVANAPLQALHSNADLSGFLGGGHIGYNYQTGNIVVGAEVSYSGGNPDGSSGPTDLTAFNLDDQVSNEVKSIFQAVLRLGYSFDKTLLYSKIGYASAKVETSLDLNQVLGPQVFGSNDERHSGLVLGGGLEYAFSSNLILGIDYSYINLGKKSHSSPLFLTATGAAAGVVIDHDIDPSIHAVSARLSYKFGGRRHNEPMK